MGGGGYDPICSFFFFFFFFFANKTLNSFVLWCPPQKKKKKKKKSIARHLNCIFRGRPVPRQNFAHSAFATCLGFTQLHPPPPHFLSSSSPNPRSALVVKRNVHYVKHVYKFQKVKVMRIEPFIPRSTDKRKCVSYRGNELNWIIHYPPSAIIKHPLVGLDFYKIEQSTKVHESALWKYV